MRQALTILLALTLLGSVHAEGDATPEESTNLFDGTSITCSATLPSVRAGCFLEAPILVLGPAEVAVGIDAQIVLNSEAGAGGNHLAPYVILGWYAPTWSGWAEVRLPELSGIPVLGDSDWLRVGITYRFGGQ